MENLRISMLCLIFIVYVDRVRIDTGVWRLYESYIFFFFFLGMFGSKFCLHMLLNFISLCFSCQVSENWTG
ncbi:hypothetical protein ACP275_04G057900 [Erythranthe tilingii]